MEELIEYIKIINLKKVLINEKQELLENNKAKKEEINKKIIDNDKNKNQIFHKISELRFEQAERDIESIISLLTFFLTAICLISIGRVLIFKASLKIILSVIGISIVIPVLGKSTSFLVEKIFQRKRSKRADIILSEINKTEDLIEENRSLEQDIAALNIQVADLEQEITNLKQELETLEQEILAKYSDTLDNLIAKNKIDFENIGIKTRS